MNNIRIFRGDEAPDFLKRVEKHRLETWGRVVDRVAASARFGLDHFDSDAWHIIYSEENKIIGSGRLIIATSRQDVPDLCSFEPYLSRMCFPLGVMNRLAVHWKHRNKGIARQINLKRIQLANDKRATELWVEVQSHMVPVMENLGFKDEGPSLDETIVGEWRVLRNNINRRSLLSR